MGKRKILFVSKHTLASALTIILTAGFPVAASAENPCPTVLADPQAMSLTPEAKVARYEELLQRVENEALLADKNISCTTGGCIPFSRYLYKGLHSYKPQLKRVKVAHEADVEGHRAYFYHFFLLDDSLGQSQTIIIDSTYLQNFEPYSWGEAPESFVGTRDQLVEFFWEHRSAIKFLNLNRSLNPRRAVEKHVDMIYGFGEFMAHLKDVGLQN